MKRCRGCGGEDGGKGGVGSNDVHAIVEHGSAVWIYCFVIGKM